MIESVKSEIVKPKDVIKAAATTTGKEITYMTAWRGIKQYKKNLKAMDNKSYQQIAGYLSSFVDCNEDLVARRC